MVLVLKATQKLSIVAYFCISDGLHAIIVSKVTNVFPSSYTNVTDMSIFELALECSGQLNSGFSKITVHLRRMVYVLDTLLHARPATIEYSLSTAVVHIK